MLPICKIASGQSHPEGGEMLIARGKNTNAVKCLQPWVNEAHKKSAPRRGVSFGIPYDIEGQRLWTWIPTTAEPRWVVIPFLMKKTNPEGSGPVIPTDIETMFFQRIKEADQQGTTCYNSAQFIKIVPRVLFPFLNHGKRTSSKNNFHI